MDKGKKILISIIIDMLLLGVVAFCVYELAVNNPGGLWEKIYTIIVALCIPIGFITTFCNVCWEKFDEKELPDEEEDNEENNEENDK